MPSRFASSAASAVVILVVGAAAPARGQAPPSPDPARSEITVFGGASILDARRGDTFTIGRPVIPVPPGFPGFPDLPELDVRVETEAKLGSTALFGARYAFYVKKQLAVEADLAVGPGHDLTTDVGVCGPGGRCYGRGDFVPAGTGAGFDDSLVPFVMGGRARGMGPRRGALADRGLRFGERNVTAWHYGAGVTYDVLGGDVRPFVALGAGGVTYDGASEAGTSFVLRFGGGLKAYFGRVGARIDVVDHVVVDHFLSEKTEHDVHATAGMLVRF